MKTYYIYALVDPRTKEIRYIGKTINPSQRLIKHTTPWYYNDGTHKGNWIKQLIRLGLKPEMTILKTVSESEWQKEEIDTIKKYRETHNLTNIDSGGSGGMGRTTSEETKDKIRDKIVKRWKLLSKEDYRKMITRQGKKSSKFFGVCSHKNGKWRAYITLNGKSKFKNAETEVDAAKIRDELVREFYPPERWAFNLS